MQWDQGGEGGVDIAFAVAFRTWSGNSICRALPHVPNERSAFGMFGFTSRAITPNADPARKAAQGLAKSVGDEADPREVAPGVPGRGDGTAGLVSGTARYPRRGRACLHDAGGVGGVPRRSWGCVARG